MAAKSQATPKVKPPARVSVASKSPVAPALPAVAAPASVAQVQHLTIDEGGAGQRLDNFLIKVLKGAPKTLVYRIIRSGEVRVNKGRASADTRLALSDEVRVPPLRLTEKDEVKAAASARVPDLVRRRAHAGHQQAGGRGRAWW